MSVNLSIKNVPDEIAEGLRRRAARHHRSLQGELLTILEEAVVEDEAISPGEALERVRSMGLSTPAEAADIVRSDRDAR